MTLTDADYMARAFVSRGQGTGRTSPNPVVGAVVVSADGVVVGQGYRAAAGSPHAEIHALGAAGETRGAARCTARSNPARTPDARACGPRIVDAGISRVVAAVEPQSTRARQGIRVPGVKGVRVDVGLGVEGLPQPSISRFQHDATRTAVCHPQGAIGTDFRRRRGAGLHAAHLGAGKPACIIIIIIIIVRAEVDAIVSVGTVLVDDPADAARLFGVTRDRVVFDRNFELRPRHACSRHAQQRLSSIVTSAAGAARVDVRRELEGTRGRYRH